MFIEKLHKISNMDAVLSEVEQIISEHGWSTKTNQICLTHRSNDNNIWHDGTGSMYDYDNRKFIGEESDLNQWNLPEDSTLRKELELLLSQRNLKLGRIRIMRLMSKTGLSVHPDREPRYHLVLKTNQYCYMLHDYNNHNEDLVQRGVYYHIPKDEHWYKVDTIKYHTVFNGGWTERWHIVVSECR